MYFNPFFINYFSNYYVLLVMFGFLVCLAFILFVVAYSLSVQDYSIEKTSPYECGFQPFSDTQSQFDIKYYIVGVLFLIFDLEILYLLPWGLNVLHLGYSGYFCVLIFIFILGLSFVFEWVSGALEWD